MQAEPPQLTMAAQREALRDGNIIGMQCACGYQQFSPMMRCPRCRSTELKQKQFSSAGKVVSYTIQSVAAEEFLNETPFAFVIVQLDDGPRVSGWVPWIGKPVELPLGQRVVFTPSYKPGMMFEKL